MSTKKEVTIENLKEQIYQRLMESTKYCDLHKAIYKALGEKFIVINPKVKAEEITEIAREWLKRLEDLNV